MTQTSTTAGIDTSKSKLDIALHGRPERWQVVNSVSGWRILTDKLTTAGVSRVGIEATGGYERGVVQHLRAAGFTVQVLQPVQVKAFGRVHLRRAKNDVAGCGDDRRLHGDTRSGQDAPDPRLANWLSN
jgi:transposase